MKFLRKYEEFKFEGSPATAPSKPSTSPTPVAPPKPGKTEPRKKPFDPIRRDKPSVDPNPKAKSKSKNKASAEDVVKRFMNELKNSDAELNINLDELKNRYKNK